MHRSSRKSTTYCGAGGQADGAAQSRPGGDTVELRSPAGVEWVWAGLGC